MFTGHKSVAKLLGDNKPFPITTFKNSLRLWQAQWKAQKAAETAAAPRAEQSRAKVVSV